MADQGLISPLGKNTVGGNEPVNPKVVFRAIFSAILALNYDQASISYTSGR